MLQYVAHTAPVISFVLMYRNATLCRVLYASALSCRCCVACNNEINEKGLKLNCMLIKSPPPFGCQWLTLEEYAQKFNCDRKMHSSSNSKSRFLNDLVRNSLFIDDLRTNGSKKCFNSERNILVEMEIPYFKIIQSWNCRFFPLLREIDEIKTKNKYCNMKRRKKIFVIRVATWSTLFYRVFSLVPRYRVKRVYFG